MTPSRCAWEGYGLDRRLVKATKRAGWVAPTAVQERAIPLILKGKDMLCRARTGAGKTAAYLIPVLQKILQLKDPTTSVYSSFSSNSSFSASFSAPRAGRASRTLILVPTNELCEQVANQITELTYYCSEAVSVLSLSPSSPNEVEDTCTTNKGGKLVLCESQKVLLRASPDIILATPSKAKIYLQKGHFSIYNGLFDTFVLDEADLILAFGHGDDMRVIATALRNGSTSSTRSADSEKKREILSLQAILMSATISVQLEELEGLILHRPAIVKLENEAMRPNKSTEAGKLIQFYVALPPEDKYLLLYVFLRLGILQGKGIIFVNSVEEAYRLRLFLSKFAIRAAALNSELPLKSRTHMLDEFNRGVFELLIATDQGMCEKATLNDDISEQCEEDIECVSLHRFGNKGDQHREVATIAKYSTLANGMEGMQKAVTKVRGRKRSWDASEEYGHGTRGIDFKGINFVLNLELPAWKSQNGGHRNNEINMLSKCQQHENSFIKSKGVQKLSDHEVLQRACDAYTHRIGRTARAGLCGTALSLISNLPQDGELALLSAIQHDQPPLPCLTGNSRLVALGPSSASSSFSAAEKRGHCNDSHGNFRREIETRTLNSALNLSKQSVQQQPAQLVSSMALCMLRLCMIPQY